MTFVDHIISEVDTALRTIFPPKHRLCKRNSPGNHIEDTPLSDKQKKQIAGLMRVNHAGEVCAQALYQGQALTAKKQEIKIKMAQAAAEEVDHLAWCEKRLYELNARPSLLNFLWYTGSFMIGAAAGWAGDKYSLGFVAETERQVSAHIEGHLQKLPEEDIKTRVILNQMQEDESQHAEMAIQAGAAELPAPIKELMRITSKLMTQSSYYF
ncbi:2-polyprenyl-3-methyl-6-methoxy-1,4-benzoquinone monooxygenase [Legionella israelensis]|uniref:3-demethoxyubiquinol 3-hydroxylase n=1 Tax=Legionella israelensis TaxID=454 RepID=A0A0W0VQN8_9GAMM|nr:2-polyprenyl-3-methyl-6-methoxy-1,4-benzoquinone monooxygenase [Legionella israelensis]KTD22462.1 ubiquinone biosynthesis protein [Legionella israelensis]QBS09575.1 2-polyprenyl-3-methyl-6-methoxy-1,4-benzoquinone monooxygenase [Legionella israelensis]QDP71592.1 2-polyprenyl-3-methyl-6-methoxy-1,4-benzoquinone monooxygenase [Legionella israelensis]SCY16760.1 ubiquinone biosynthesis monooxygenase Coq7 [Legionella israelensis DSM 19235]STX60497.1 ubiquinone biosynthesis protein [Legionella is